MVIEMHRSGFSVFGQVITASVEREFKEDIRVTCCSVCINVI